MKFKKWKFKNYEYGIFKSHINERKFFLLYQTKIIVVGL